MEIMFDETGIKIDGTYHILLASSLFYFRIPEERWDRRMKLLKTAGYNAIDVYFPWNYHEISPGEWNFQDNRNVEYFLELARKNDLFVIARPGPYICSEWDGGAIPAWLYADGIPVRQDDPAFLEAMHTWYSHILPILGKYQITRGGTVICMQIENELDFYDCKSPVTYMDKLKKMAESFGMEVPLFYCCGQDDIVKSGGLTEGLYSSFNVYAPEDYPDLEVRAMHLYESAALRKMPFMITETNREHDFLKRLLASGAKLLGPYNQTAGTTMDYYTGITNWGPKEHPVAIMTTDYDFKSMIGSAGNYDQCIIKARLFAGMLSVFGEAAGRGIPEKSTAVLSGTRTNHTAAALVTEKGTLLDVSNLAAEHQVIQLTLSGECYDIQMAPCETKLLPVDLKITEEVMLHFANYELASILTEEDHTIVWLYGEGRVVLSAEQKGKRELYEIEHPQNGAEIQIGSVIFRFGNDLYVSEHGLPFLPKLAVMPGEQEEEITAAAEIYDCTLAQENVVQGSIQPMELFGQYRGIGVYDTTLPESGNYLLSGLADIVTLSQGENSETAYCNGSTRICSFEKGTLQVMTEIWGHANFDDIRVKSLHMGSLKGMNAQLQISRTEDLTNGWLGYETTETPQEICYFRHSPYNAMMNADGYNRAASPLITMINRTIDSSENEDGLFLHFEKAECMIEVYVNNHRAASVVKDDPYVDLSEYAGSGSMELTLYVYRRYYTDEIGRITLYAGKKLDCCSYARVAPKRGIHLNDALPMKLTEHKNQILELTPEAESGDDLKLFFYGKNVKLTIYTGGHVMGRIYLSENPIPAVSGGTSNTTFVLGEWVQNEPVTIWCQAIGPDAEVSEVVVKRYKDGVSR